MLVNSAGGPVSSGFASDGSLGVGTTTPGDKVGVTGNLLVNGTTTTDGLIVTTASIKINGIQYEFPGNDGDADQVLTTDGSGALSWTAGGGGGGGADDFEKLADVTLASASTTLIAQDFSQREYIRVIVTTVVNTAATSNVRLQANSDTSTNYSDRYSNAGGADSTETSQSGIFVGDAIGGESIMVCDIMNKSSSDKSFYCLHNRGGSAGTAPNRTESAGIWGNTSHQIHTITVNSMDATQYFASGSRIIVYGVNP